MKMEGLGFPGRGGDSLSVEMVGCCLFSNSRSFAARFSQIMLHKQAWLTWYLRKLNNSQAYGSLQRGNTLCDCAARLLVFWSSRGARTGFKSLSQRKMQRAVPLLLLVSVISSLFVTSGNAVSVLISGLWCHPVQHCVSVCVCVCVRVHVRDVYEILFSLHVVVFRFILVFSCLVLSVFSTIPAHQDFSSYCLLILVRDPTADGLNEFTIASVPIPLGFGIIWNQVLMGSNRQRSWRRARVRPR